MLGAAGLGLSQNSHAMEPRVAQLQPDVIQLSKNGWMTNNEHLPVLLYRCAVSIEGQDPAALFEALFERNGWPPQWLDGVYDFHHYHSTAHEVLGFVGGHAALMLGGESCRRVPIYS